MVGQGSRTLSVNSHDVYIHVHVPTCTSVVQLCRKILLAPHVFTHPHTTHRLPPGVFKFFFHNSVPQLKALNDRDLLKLADVLQEVSNHNMFYWHRIVCIGIGIPSTHVQYND